MVTFSWNTRCFIYVFFVSLFSVCESANSREKRNTSIISCVSQMPFYFCKCLFFFYGLLLRLPVFFSHSIINTLVNEEISCNNNPKTFFFFTSFSGGLVFEKTKSGLGSERLLTEGIEDLQGWSTSSEILCGITNRQNAPCFFPPHFSV